MNQVLIPLLWIPRKDNKYSFFLSQLNEAASNSHSCYCAWQLSLILEPLFVAASEPGDPKPSLSPDIESNEGREPADSNAIPTSEEGPIAANDLDSYPPSRG